MAISTGAAILGSAAIGALANRDSGSGSQNVNTVKNVAPASASEKNAASSVEEILRQLQAFQAGGPGAQDVSNAYTAQQDLGSMLKQFSQGNYAPTQNDFAYAQQATAPQAEQLRQSQNQARTDFARNAALTGRGPNDFAFTNKMNQNFQNANLMLGAQQQQIAMQQPMQRLSFAQDYANLQQGLASQAMQNRLMISNLGASIRDAERNFRLGAAGGSTYQNSQQGSQTGNMLTGALAGLGSMGKISGLMNSFGGSPNSGASNAPVQQGQMMGGY